MSLFCNCIRQQTFIVTSSQKNEYALFVINDICEVERNNCMGIKSIG